MKKYIVLFLFLISFSTSIAQIPKEYIMGKLTMNTGSFSYSGIYTNQPDKSRSLGAFLKFSMIVPNGNNYTEIGSDAPLAIALQLMNGLSNVSRLSFTEIKDYKESQLGTPNEGNRLFYRYWDIISLSQSFKVYDDFMLGYHAGGEGMTANESDANLELTEFKSLDLAYWTLGPVLAYQTDDLRIETKLKYFFGKRASKGRNLSFKADYFITNDAESLSVALGVYADRVWFGESATNAGSLTTISSFGISLSFLYPSILNLL